MEIGPAHARTRLVGRPKHAAPPRPLIGPELAARTSLSGGFLVQAPGEVRLVKVLQSSLLGGKSAFVRTPGQFVDRSHSVCFY